MTDRGGPGAPPLDTSRPPRQGSVRGLLVLALILLLCCVLSLFLGSRSIASSRVVDVLLHPDGSTEATIVRELRFARTLLAVLVGLCLGVGGALMQGHTRNALADPGLLGVSAGAAFAVVLGIYAFGVSEPLGYAWFALAGAGVAATVVFVIGSTRGGPDPVSLVLAGTAVSALLGAFTQGLVLSDTSTLNDYRFWVVGSVNGPGFDVLLRVLPFAVAGLVLAAAGSGALNLLQLGDDSARSLGLNPLHHKAMGITAVMLLTGSATAACGPIGFVGLVVPHLARFLAGVDYRWVLPYAGVVGALLVLLADILGRVIVPGDGELQVGIVMALLGGPIFVILVRRMRLVKL